MTLTQPSSSSHSRPSAPLSDPRHAFATCVATAGRAMGAVRPDQLDLPTPCTDFDVRALLGHLTGVVHRVVALGRGEDPFALAFDPDRVGDDAWSSEWDAATATAAAVWSDDSVLTRVMRLPWAELPGAGILAGYVNEVTVHTWDLATATGQHPEWDDAVLEVAFAAIRQALPAEGRTAAFEEGFKNLPAHLRNQQYPFAEAVDVADDAPLVDRLVAYNGRRP
ncbi:MAG: TIGR03086 family metal-binding protein [Candidatus Dormibacteria bacterium]